MLADKVYLTWVTACAVLLAINAGLSADLAKEQAANNINTSVAQGALAA